MIDSLSEHLQWLTKYWHVVTGVVLATWWMLVRIKRSMFSDYVTNDDMTRCKGELVTAISEHEKRENIKQAGYSTRNEKAHDRIERKVDQLLDHILGGK